MRPRRKGKRRDEPWVIYSRGEDIFYMILHIVTAVAAAGMLTTAVVFSALSYTWPAVLSAVIYGSSMLIVHILLSIYHGLPYGIGKDVMYIVARNMLYLFFAGTGLAVNIICPAPVIYAYNDLNLFLMILMCVFGVAGIVFTSISMEKFRVTVYTCYFMMIWVMAIRPVFCTTQMRGLAVSLLIAGNIAYTICGICRYLGDENTFPRILKKITFYIGIFTHFACIMLIILP